MSELQEFIKAVASFSRHPLHAFMLEHGRRYLPDVNTFEGEAMAQGLCYMNCTHRVIGDPALTYCEGQVLTMGVPIDHAWLLTEDGRVIDPTLRASIKGESPRDRITEYFGIPFDGDYLRRSTLRNGYYGLLGWNAKTLDALIAGKAKNFRSRRHP